MSNCPQTMIVEAVNKAAFREGLGNSIYASPDTTITSDIMKKYASVLFTGPNAALVGTGVDAKDFESVASTAFSGVPAAGSGSPIKKIGNYFGGEIRQETADSEVHMAIAYKGAAKGTKDSLALVSSNTFWGWQVCQVRQPFF